MSVCVCSAFLECVSLGTDAKWGLRGYRVGYLKFEMIRIAMSRKTKHVAEGEFARDRGRVSLVPY